jgi:HEPN domain-containing protein
MTKKEHIAYWLKTANEDWKTVNYLLKGKRFVNTLFFAHLVLEKLCKAHWVKDNVGNHPPKIHNLIYLIDNTKLKVDSEQRQLLEKMNAFQLAPKESLREGQVS